MQLGADQRARRGDARGAAPAGPRPRRGAAAARRPGSASTSPATCAPGSASARRRGSTSPRSRRPACRSAPRRSTRGCRTRSARRSRTAARRSSTRSTSCAPTRPSCPASRASSAPQFFEDKLTIGVWAWEASAIPDGWDDAFALVDEIWTYSDYVTSVLSAASPVPVVTLPQPVLHAAGRRGAAADSSSATRSRSCSRSTSSRPRGARTRSGSSRRSRARSSRTTARSS